MFQVIARYRNGQVLKGLTGDFAPSRPVFHVSPSGCCPGTPAVPVPLNELKGVFFVRHLDGNPAHAKRNNFDPTDLTPGRQIRVVFQDGEVLQGHAPYYHPEHRGFFVMPADQRSNNIRCFVLRAATAEIALL
jgi:hypothetical protein